MREASEECAVNGAIIKKTCEYADPFDESARFYTYKVDIGDQPPKLGYDPEASGNAVLAGVGWLALNEICARNRVYLWAAGLLSSPGLRKKHHLGGTISAIPASGADIVEKPPPIVYTGFVQATTRGLGT